LISIKIAESPGANMGTSEFILWNKNMRLSTWLGTALLAVSAGVFAASSVDLYKDPG
jgi:hypothetical protein